jgi:hypothetical protein
MIENEVYATGLALNFFDSAKFEPLEEGNSSGNSVKIGRNVLRLIMMGWQENWKDLLSRKIFSAVFIERDHQLTRGLRQAFQEGFRHVYSQLEGQQLSGMERNQAELYISNCLTYLPFADITPFESFAIPQCINDEWQLVDYKVVPIELTPTWGFKKLFIRDTDRVFAYGLEPINKPDALPHLIFMGTTYPAGQGFTSQVNTDLESFETVGKKLYRSGHKNITNWLNKQTNKVHVCGTSLGGSLALLLATDQGDKLSRVDALNPAGLYHSCYKSKFDHWDGLFDQPPVFIQKQKGRHNKKGDPVSRFGVWKPEWHILSVTPPVEKSGPNSLSDHALNYAGFAETEFVGVDTKKDNDERRVRNFWAYTLGRSTLYYLTQLPYRYFILPVADYIINNKLQCAIAASLFVFLCLFPVFAAGIAIPFLGATFVIAINAGISASIGAYLVSNFLFFIKDKFTLKKESDLSKFADWFIGQSILVKSLFVVGFAAASAAMLAVLFVPTLLPLVASTTLFFIAGIPLMMKTVYTVFSLLKTIIGLNEVKGPECHNPDMERNASMDIYTNFTEATFTYEEIGDYYFAKRHLLKDKPLYPPIPADSNVEEKRAALAKIAMIKKGVDGLPEERAATISVKASKAKIAAMQETVSLIKRFGIFPDNHEKLIPEISEVQRIYSNGKK